MASNPDFFRRWLHSEEAQQGWEEIYGYTNGYVQREQGGFVSDPQNGKDEPDVCQSTDESSDESSDQTDTAALAAAIRPVKLIPTELPAAIVNSSVTWSVGVPCKCYGPCKCEDSYTIIQYRNLTIRIYGGIPVGTNLISLCIYECLCLPDNDDYFIIRPYVMMKKLSNKENVQFALRRTKKPIHFKPMKKKSEKKKILFETVGKGKQKNFYLYNSSTNSYLKIEENDGSYTVWVAPAGKDKKKMFNDKLSTFIKSGSTVFHLSEDIEYALKYGTTDEFVIVEKHVKGDQDFQFIFHHPPGYGLELCTDPADM
ncbi:uncharacterized protein [Dysidea avara]|uniref:uncharacterized protein isoform X2 n=1 Tax=Dysidea avara TaxID=196820 RepID=UPI003332992D